MPINTQKSQPISSNLVFEACLHQNIALLESYQTLGVDFNTVYFYGDGLLHFAIFNDKSDSVAALLDWGVDPNQVSLIDGATPLHVAAGFGFVQYLEPLLAHGADLNTQDFYGDTPLGNSILFNQEQFASALLAYDELDVNLGDTDFLTPLEMSFYLDHKGLVDPIIQHGSFDVNYACLLLAGSELTELYDYLLMQDFEIDFDLIEAFLSVKLLGLRFEYDDCFTLSQLDDYQQQCFSFEGYGNLSGKQAFSYSYESFFDAIVSESELPDWVHHVFSLVGDVMHFAAATQDPQAYVDEYHKNQPVLVVSGWDGHSISFVLYGDLLYRCNRGELAHDTHGVEIFHISNSDAINYELINIMLKAEGDPEFLSNELIELLSLSKLGGFEIPHQIVGNCVWANLEGGLEALIHASLVQQGVDMQTALILAEQSYELWQEYDHHLAITDVISHADILMENNLFDDLLLRVLDDHHDAANPYDVILGQSILETLVQPDHYEVFDHNIGQYVVTYDPTSSNDISYMNGYDLTYVDWFNSVVGINYLFTSNDDWSKGQSYFDFLLACEQLSDENQIYQLGLEDIFSAYYPNQQESSVAFSDTILQPTMPTLSFEEDTSYQAIMI